MGRHDDAATFFRQVAQFAAEEFRPLGVEVALGFVDKQYLRGLVELDGQENALALARGQTRGGVGQELLKRPQFDDFSEVNASGPGDEIDVLAHGEVR